eukprot:3315569-Pleurochrysis_carterae.AAC.2
MASSTSSGAGPSGTAGPSGVRVKQNRGVKREANNTNSNENAGLAARRAAAAVSMSTPIATEIVMIEVEYDGTPVQRRLLHAHASRYRPQHYIFTAWTSSGHHLKFDQPTSFEVTEFAVGDKIQIQLTASGQPAQYYGHISYYKPMQTIAEHVRASHCGFTLEYTKMRAIVWYNHPDFGNPEHFFTRQEYWRHQQIGHVRIYQPGVTFVDMHMFQIGLAPITYGPQGRQTQRGIYHLPLIRMPAELKRIQSYKTMTTRN